ncbi:hypothetical protein JW707_04030 [Candidatus Woesearchaeota archaeon]|nr:hypothetical protein [Candidatus Woesearchaeota archaeon]
MEKKELLELLNEAEIIGKSPSFMSDFNIWKVKAQSFIERFGNESSKARVSKIIEKDALYLYSFETDRDDLEVQAIKHNKWQLNEIVGILRAIQ